MDAKTQFEALYLRTLAFNYWFTGSGCEREGRGVAGTRCGGGGYRRSRQDSRSPRTRRMTPGLKSLAGPHGSIQLHGGNGLHHAERLCRRRDVLQGCAGCESRATPVTYFRLGVAYLSTTPPQSMDGFWALARSVSLKGPSQAQVQKYLRGQLSNYQGGARLRQFD